MSEVVDPYLDPDTGLLRNLVGARTQSALDAAEGALVFARAVQLVDHPVRPTGDLDEFRAIHRHAMFDQVVSPADATAEASARADRLAVSTRPGTPAADTARSERDVGPDYEQGR